MAAIYHFSMESPRGTEANGTASASAMRALACVIALVDVALLAYGYPWQVVIFLALVGAVVVAAAYPAWRRSQTHAEMLVISCTALLAYAVLIVAISAAFSD
jgi:glucose-6-phosphate-specific signal transduction histidine kinase